MTHIEFRQNNIEVSAEGEKKIINLLTISFVHWEYNGTYLRSSAHRSFSLPRNRLLKIASHFPTNNTHLYVMYMYSVRRRMTNASDAVHNWRPHE